MQSRNFKQAAQMSLDERWYPIVEATSLDEMNSILYSTNCELCLLRNRRNLMVRYAERVCSVSHISKMNCRRCPMNDKDERGLCSKEYQDWVAASHNNDSGAALKAALAVVARLEKIAGIKCEEVNKNGI